jgi:hypothetical protein
VVIFWDTTPCSPLKFNRHFGVPWGWRRYIPTKRRLTFSGLQGVISQKINNLLRIRSVETPTGDCCDYETRTLPYLLFHIDPREWEPWYLELYSDGLHTGQPWFESRQKQKIFLLSTASRPVLRPTQPRIQWVLSVPVPHVHLKRTEYEADHSPPSNAEVKNGGAVTPLPHMSSSLVDVLSFLQNFTL